MMQLLINQVPETATGPDGAPMQVKFGMFSEGAQSLDEIWRKTRTLKPPFHRMPKGCDVLIQLLDKILDKKMLTRITAEQALSDPWFTAPSVGHLPLAGAPLPTSPCLLHRSASEITVQRREGQFRPVAAAPRPVAAPVATPSPCASPVATPRIVAAPLQVPRYIARSSQASVRPAPAPIPQNTPYVMPRTSSQPIFGEPPCAVRYAR